MAGSTCHFCGTFTTNGYETNGTRHYLSDCRPDLTHHEIGSLCTWPIMPYGGNWTNEKVDNWNKENNRPDCYAYRNDATRQKTTEHIHFHTDGPM